MEVVLSVESIDLHLRKIQYQSLAILSDYLQRYKRKFKMFNAHKKYKSLRPPLPILFGAEPSSPIKAVESPEEKLEMEFYSDDETFNPSKRSLSTNFKPSAQLLISFEDLAREFLGLSALEKVSSQKADLDRSYFHENQIDTADPINRDLLLRAKI